MAPRSPLPLNDSATVSAARLSPTRASSRNKPWHAHFSTALKATTASKHTKQRDSHLVTRSRSQSSLPQSVAMNSTGFRPWKRVAPPPHGEASKTTAQHSPATILGGPPGKIRRSSSSAPVPGSGLPLSTAANHRAATLKRDEACHPRCLLLLRVRPT